jgi:CTD kinase subunit beta
MFFKSNLHLVSAINVSWSQDVTLAVLYVSTKMHDTLKKPRELLMVSYAVRFPELVAKSKSIGGEIDVDPNTVEHDRQRLLAVERLALETICFNFTSRMSFPYVIKLGRAFGATKKMTKLAWRLAIDSHRTLVPIQYPPHVVALASLYVAALLSSFEQPNNSSHQIAAILSKRGQWEHKFQAQVEDLEVIAHAVLDLLIQGAQNPSANTSPRTPSSPSPHPSPRNSHISSALPQSQPLVVPYKADQLIRLKIVMRETEHPPRPRQPLGNADPSALYSGNDSSLLGRNEGTVRFLFGPPGIVGNGV